MSTRKWSWALIVTALLLRGGIVAASISRRTIGGYVPDDSFYYFVIARNIVLGEGSTFDGLSPTNGYHPLWMLLILPIFATAEPELGAVLAAVMMSAVVWVAGGSILVSLVEELTRSKPAALGALALYLFGPVPILLSLHGLEASVVTVVFLALLWWIARGRSQPEAVESRSYFAILGFLAGILFLARTDTAFVSAIVLGTMMCRAFARNDPIAVVRDYGLAAACGAIVAAPWIAWNLATFGEVVQVSGKAGPFIHQTYAREVQMMTGGQMLVWSVDHSLNMFTEFWRLCGLRFLPRMGIGMWMGVVTVVLWLVAFWKVRQTEGWRLHGDWLAATGLALTGLICMHAALRWNVRPWYWGPSIVFAYSMLVYVLDSSIGKRALPVAIGISILATAAYSREVFSEGIYPEQIEWLQKLESSDVRHWPAGSRVGIADSGMESYFGGPSQIINLDGVVNNRVLEFYRHGQGIEYIRDVGIEYVNSHLPELHPIFMGSAGIQLKSISGAPYGIAKRYRVLEDAAAMEAEHFPKTRVHAGMTSANRYFGVGWLWHDEDQAMRWSQGPKSILHLPLRAGRSYSLNLQMGILAGVEEQGVTVRFNGSAVARSGLELRLNVIDAQLLEGVVRDGPNEITLVVDKVVSPHSLGTSEDTRPMGVSLLNFEVRELGRAGGPLQ